MKKYLITLLLAVTAFTTAHAQFEEGKKYVGATLSGLGLSYSPNSKFSLGIGANGGYMVDKNWMLIADLGFNYTFKDLQQFNLGAKCRYYIEQNGIFASMGVQYIHLAKSTNDIQLTPEVGYCFFLTKNLVLDPSIYYDISLTHFSNLSKVGLKVGISVLF